MIAWDGGNIGNAFFEDHFDYHKYIEDRLLEVEDLNERKELKEVMRKTLLPFYEQVEEAYRLLEEKLCEKRRRIEVAAISLLVWRTRGA